MFEEVLNPFAAEESTARHALLGNAGHNFRSSVFSSGHHVMSVKVQLGWDPSVTLCGTLFLFTVAQFWVVLGPMFIPMVERGK